MIRNENGFSFIKLLVFLAFVFAAFNAYAYYDPTFVFSKFSISNIIRDSVDKTRIEHLKTLEEAILTYNKDKNKLPATDGWCGRISTVLHPEFANEIKPYLPNNKLPSDPTHGNSPKDYFYYRVDRSRFILMAAMDLPQDDGTAGKYSYNFKKCHDWPGNDVYNYQIRNF